MAITASKSSLPFWISRNQIFAADDVRACILSFLLLVTERQHCYFLCVAGSEGKDYCAAYLLVCMTGINAQTNMEFEAFIKFRGRAFFRERYCLREGILLCKINFFEQRLVTFSFFAILSSSLW